MSVKNTLDGSIVIDNSSTEIVPINLQYMNLFSVPYQSMYSIVGNMCILYLPSITQTPTASTPSPIQITLPVELAAANRQFIHGFTVNDADGTQNCKLELDSGFNIMLLTKEDGSGFNNTGPVSITRYRYIIYELYSV